MIFPKSLFFFVNLYRSLAAAALNFRLYSISDVKFRFERIQETLSIDVRRFVGQPLPQQCVFIFAFQQIHETDTDDLSDHFRLGQTMSEGGKLDTPQICIVKSDRFYPLGTSLVHIFFPSIANTFVFYARQLHLSRSDNLILHDPDLLRREIVEVIDQAVEPASAASIWRLRLVCS